MCRVQISIYFLCICINILIPTTRATIQNNGSLKNHEQTFHQNKTQKYDLPMYPTKTELRQYLLKRIAKMSVLEIARQSEVITKRLFKHIVYRHSRRIGIYISKTYQVQTYEIIKDIIESGKECFIPKYDKYNNMTMVKLKSMDDFHRVTLIKNKNNLTQPADNDVREIAGSLHLIIVPGLGFTLNGERLGRGTGSYDRYLNSYDKHIKWRSYMALGLSLNEQLCEYIPMTPKDHKVDFVMYDDMWGAIDLETAGRHNAIDHHITPDF